MLLFNNSLSFIFKPLFFGSLSWDWFVIMSYTSFWSVFVCQWLCQLVEKWGSSLWSSICLLLLQRRGSPHSSFFILLSVLTLCHQWINFLLLAAVRWGNWAIRQKDSRGRKRKEWNIFSMTQTEDRLVLKARPALCFSRGAWIYHLLCVHIYFHSCFAEKQLDGISFSGSTQNCPREMMCPAVVLFMSFFKSQHFILLRDRTS